MTRPADPIRLVQFLLHGYQGRYIFGVVHILSESGEVCCVSNYYPRPRTWEIHEPRPDYQATCRRCRRIAGFEGDPA